MPLGTYIASLNLFREADGSYWITVSGSSPELLKSSSKENMVPVDWLVEPIKEGAANYARSFGPHRLNPEACDAKRD